MKTRGSSYRLKYYDFWFLGKKYIGCNLSLGQFSWGAVFLEAICPRGIFADNKSSEREFFSGAISRGLLSRGNYLWSNCLGAIIQGRNIPRGQLSGGGGQLSGDNFPDIALYNGHRSLKYYIQNFKTSLKNTKI